MSQIQSIQTFADSGANSDVNALRLNSHVNDATLLNGAVISQAERTAPNAADTLLLGDNTADAAGVPLKVQVQNLLLQSQRDGTQRWGGVAGGSANSLVLTSSPASTGSYVAGETIRFKTAGGANTGAVQLNLDTRGFAALQTMSGAALIAGDLPANTVCEAVYDGSNFLLVNFVVENKSITSYDAAETLRGDVQQYAAATNPVDNNHFVVSPVDSSGANTFTALVTGMTVRFKAANANTGATQLQVNGLTATAIKRVVGGSLADLAANDIQAGDLCEAVYDGTNFKLIGKVRSWDYVSTASATLAAGVTQFPHVLGFTPTKVRVVFVCTTAQSPWTVTPSASEIDSGNVQLSGGGPRISWWADATNINVSLYANNVLSACDTNGSTQVLTAGSWKLKVYASL
jgi:hypothetical protein